MRSSVRLLKFLRQTHLYLGLFISPALLFFALSGALQTFGLHETTKGSTYQPPAWVLAIASVHKHQALGGAPKVVAPDASAPPKRPKAAPTAAPRPEATIKLPPHLAEKLFFLLVALSLVTSTLTGIYMAYKYNRSKVLVSGILLAGVIVPVVLLKF